MILKFVHLPKTQKILISLHRNITFPQIKRIHLLRIKGYDTAQMFFQRRKLYNPVILSLELKGEKKFKPEKNKSIMAKKTEQNKKQTKKAKISKTKKGGNVLLISL